MGKIEYMEEKSEVSKNEFENLQVGESPNLKNDEGKDKGSSPLYLGLTILVTFIALFSLTFSTGLFFHNFYYTSIFVDGTSMYPTLNGYEDIPNYRDHGGNYVGEKVDFGIINTNEHFFETLERFDIVATYYPDDYDANGNLKSSASLKIKRLMVLPNEQFYFDENGDLWVRSINSLNTEFKFIEQDFYDAFMSEEERDNEYKKVTSNIPSEPRTLNEDEYWVMGDNRGVNPNTNLARSNDCQYFLKPVKKEYIVGVLVAIEGTCTLANDNNHRLTCENKNYTWPILF